MGKVFKTAVFGGFRKKDVIEYLEVLARDRRIETAQLEDQLAAVEERNQELRTALASAEQTAYEGAQAERLSMAEELSSRQQAWQAERKVLLANVEALEDDKRELEARQVCLNADLTGLRVERDGLLDTVARLEQQLVSKPKVTAAPPPFAGEALPDSGGDVNRLLPTDMKARLIELVDEINCLLESGGGETGLVAEDTDVPALEQKLTKLHSVGDILHHVKKRGDAGQ